MILQVVVNLAFYPSENLAHVLVILGVLSPGALDQPGWQAGSRDDGDRANQRYVDFRRHAGSQTAALSRVLCRLCNT
jgi:hypothetical protein